MVRASVAELPAPSLAVTVMILSSPQWRGMPEIVQLFVPEAVPRTALLSQTKVPSLRSTGYVPSVLYRIMVPAKLESAGFVQFMITWPSPGVAVKAETSAGGVIAVPTLCQM